MRAVLEAFGLPQPAMTVDLLTFLERQFRPVQNAWVDRESARGRVFYAEAQNNYEWILDGAEVLGRELPKETWLSYGARDRFLLELVLFEVAMGAAETGHSAIGSSLNPAAFRMASGGYRQVLSTWDWLNLRFWIARDAVAVSSGVSETETETETERRKEPETETEPLLPSPSCAGCSSPLPSSAAPSTTPSTRQPMPRSATPRSATSSCWMR